MIRNIFFQLALICIFLPVMHNVFASGVNFNDTSVKALSVNAPTLSSPVLTGNIGIATTTAQSSLSVLGNVGIGTWTAAGGNLIINGGGNVGVGSAWPGVKLDVNGIVRATSFSGNGSGLSNVTYAPAGGVNAVQYNNAGSIAGSEAVFSFNGTNVGIGTSNATQLLDVRGVGSFSGNLGIGTVLTSLAGLVVMNGNVGIGTWAPSSILNIKGVSPILTLMDSNAYTGDLALISNAGDHVTHSFAGDALLKSNSGRLILVGNGAILFGDATNEYMRLDTSSGNLGIGTTNPFSQLNVVGNGVGIGTGKNSSYTKTTAPSGGMIVEGNMGINTYAPVRALQVNSGSNAVVVTSAGNLGIGTVSTSAGIDIYQRDGIRVIGTNSSSLVWQSSAANVNNYILAANSDQRLSFSNASTEVFTLTSNANVGINTSAPSNKLSVVGNIGVAASTGSIFQSNAAPTGGMILESNVGLGTTKPQTQLAVLGNVGIGTWTSSSGRVIISGGNVGLGTFNTGALLESVGIGTTNASSNLIVRNATNNILFSVLNNGNIGVGTSGPNAKVQIHSASVDSVLYFTSTAAGNTSGTYLGQKGTNDFYFMNEKNAAISIGSNNLTRLNFYNAGNIGLGTTGLSTPTAKLSVFNGPINTNGTAPSLSTCGTGPSVSGTDTMFTITGGTGATACTATFSSAKSKAPVCTVSAQYATTTNSYSVTTTAVVYTDAALGTNKISVFCMGLD